MTKVIAHRGAWKEYDLPQNSIASLKKAFEIGANASEFDVHRTLDDVLVVFHDDELNGVRIEDYLWQDLQKTRLSNGEMIPLLQQFFDERDELGATKLILEVKSSPTSVTKTLQCVRLVANATLKEGIHPHQVEFILFSWEGALLLKELLPHFSVSYLNGDRSVSELKEANLDGFDYYFESLLTEEKFISDSKIMNLQSNAWTVNKWEDAAVLIRYGIDYITTDYPKLFLDTINKKTL